MCFVFLCKGCCRKTVFWLRREADGLVFVQIAQKEKGKFSVLTNKIFKRKLEIEGCFRYNMYCP